MKHKVTDLIVVVPGISLLYTLDQKSLLPDEGVD